MTTQNSIAAVPIAQKRRSHSAQEIRRNRRSRLPFLTLGIACFLAALYGGLWRLGWALPHAETLGDLHGPLMIGGFFGTLIGLERAVALDKPWVFAAPALSSSGAMLLLTGAPLSIGGSLMVAGGVALAGASLVALGEKRRLFTAILAIGAACWTLGQIVWLGTRDVPLASPWWLLFLVLTITAERLDSVEHDGAKPLARVLLVGCILLLLAGALRGLLDPVGAILLGAGFILLASWLLRHDAAFMTMRGTPYLRFFGLSMSAGYLWMAAAGLALLFAPPASTPFGYDLVLHAILIGFVLSMAIGHAVIVIPAITGAAAPYHPAMYVGLCLLHASVAMRVCADAFAWMPGRLVSGPLTLAGLLAFGLVLGLQIRRTSETRGR